MDLMKDLVLVELSATWRVGILGFKVKSELDLLDLVHNHPETYGIMLKADLCRP